MKFNEPSWLHRRMRYGMGRVPAWLISRRGCGGIDVFGVAFCALFFGGLFVLASAISIGLLMIKTAFAVLCVWHPVEHCERFSRARIRRRECVRCGANAESLVNDRCGNCS